MNLSPEKKLAGYLLTISALRGSGDLGIGDTQALVECAKWASEKGFGLLQILPVYETGSDHSPYNIISSIAIEPSTMATNPEWLPDLSRADYDTICARYPLDKMRTGPVPYAQVKKLKRELLEAAYAKFRGKSGDKVRGRAFLMFEKNESDWLEAYALFRALVDWNGTEVTHLWPKEHRSPDLAQEWMADLPAPKKKKFREMLGFFSYVQWVARTQWKTVRAACDRLGVALVGDIPVGVSLYSADVWAEPQIFDLQRSSGAPPEKVFKSNPFTERWGQNWGFPLYDWHAMSHDNFAWWRRRLSAAKDAFHFLRVDHALGFFRIYSFPWRPEDNDKFLHLSDDQARELTGGPLPCFMQRDDSSDHNRDQNRRQGEALLKIFLEETGPHRLIAEDLGEVPPYVRPVLQELSLPGFKIPQWERTPDGRMISGADYERLSLATYATHDHPPVRAFWEEWAAAGSDHDIRSMREMLDFCGASDLSVPQAYTPEVHAALVRGLFATNSWLAVLQITDLFGLSERFNIPGAVGDQNWTTRIEGQPGEWDTLHRGPLDAAIKALAETGRLPSRNGKP